MTQGEGDEVLRTRDFGFWAAIGDMRTKAVVFSWDFLMALVLSVSSAVLLAHHSPAPASHERLATNLLQVGGALFGVILAGFAIVAALLGDKYSRLLQSSGSSSLKMLRHFVIVAGVLVWSVICALGLSMAATPLHAWEPVAEQLALAVTLFLFLWGLFSTLELMKLVLGVAVTSDRLRSVEQDP